jgi:hypothetical protein
LIRELASSVGFYQTHTWGDGGPSVWLELRKPGKLYSIRGGQTLAQVKGWEEIQRDLDFIRKRAYTQEEVDAMHHRAKTIGAKRSEYEKLELWQWEGYLDDFAAERELEQRRKLDAERMRLDKERQIEVEAMRTKAHSLGINADNFTNEFELQKKISEVENNFRKKNLAELRKRALELELGPPNLIKYGYSEEKLKQLITEREIADREVVLKQEKEAEQERQNRRAKIYARAREIGINPSAYADENQVLNKIKAVEKILKEQELARLKLRVVALGIADPDLIMNTLNREQLIQLLEEKEREKK